jgi:hypothetical protein
VPQFQEYAILKLSWGKWGVVEDSNVATISANGEEGWKKESPQKS